jgi:lipid A 3-O-deacylase
MSFEREYAIDPDRAALQNAARGERRRQTVLQNGSGQSELSIQSRNFQRSGWRSAVAAALTVCILWPTGADAQTSSDDGILTMQFENDLFGNSDGHFTHGTRLAWMAPENRVPEWVTDAASYVPLFDETASKRVVFSLGQNIYTPDDITARNPDPNDRPYAGWTYIGVGLVSVDGDQLDNLQLDIGIVGPYSLAEDVQKAWHEWFGFARPEGWDSQLRNEPGFVLTYERKWRQWKRFGLIGLDGDLTPHAGASVGNVLTQAATGFTIRLGNDLARNYDYGPPRIRPSLPGSDFFVLGGGFSWYVFAGIEARGVLRNIFLDGNTFRDSASVDKKPFVGDIQAGVAFIIGPARVSYTHTWRSREFETQDDTDQFGALSLSLAF